VSKLWATVSHIAGEVFQVAAVAILVPGLVPAKVAAIIWAVGKALAVFGVQVSLPNVPPGSALVTVPNTMLTAQAAGKASATVAGVPDGKGAIIVPIASPAWSPPSAYPTGRITPAGGGSK
jgi:hypothetical protein